MSAAQIHPTAIVHDGAEIGAGCQIGPFCEVGPLTELGEGCVLHARSSVIGATRLGRNCVLHSGAIVGGGPQSIGFEPDASSRLTIGEGCVFREFSSVHTGLPAFGGITRIGERCYFMQGAHAGHDCQFGDDCVLANSAVVGGHCVVGNRVWMGGTVAVHQFTEIGDNAFIGGGSILVGDVIPFGIVSGNRARLRGLNITGLKRRGFSREQIHRLRAVYRALFETDGDICARVAGAAAQFAGHEDAMSMIDFVGAKRKRPLCLPDA